MLVGVSRVGKTPLSMYLSVLGWKVANILLVPGMPPKPERFQLDRRRVIGLHLEPDQLLIHRRRQLGAPEPSAYADPAAFLEEVEAAKRVFKQGDFSVVDVTHKPIETSADEIIRLITRQLQEKYPDKTPGFSISPGSCLKKGALSGIWGCQRVLDWLSGVSTLVVGEGNRQLKAKVLRDARHDFAFDL